MENDPDQSKEPAAESAPETTHIHAAAAGMGAVMGGAFAGASVGVVAGPIGAAVGAVAGAVLGAIAGQVAAETMDLDAEDAYWREQHWNEMHATASRTQEDYRAAYRIGYATFDQFAGGTTFEQAEPTLRERYEAEQHALPWHEARLAAASAWKRAARGESFRKPAPHASHGDLSTASVRTILSEARGDIHGHGAVSTGATGMVPKPGWP